jgi:hypothetical protein
MTAWLTPLIVAVCILPFVVALYDALLVYSRL